jgi:hypothetical protein
MSILESYAILQIAGTGILLGIAMTLIVRMILDEMQG